MRFRPEKRPPSENGPADCIPDAEIALLPPNPLAYVDAARHVRFALALVAALSLTVISGSVTAAPTRRTAVEPAQQLPHLDVLTSMPSRPK